MASRGEATSPYWPEISILKACNRNNRIIIKANLAIHGSTNAAETNGSGMKLLRSSTDSVAGAIFSPTTCLTARGVTAAFGASMAAYVTASSGHLAHAIILVVRRARRRPAIGAGAHKRDKLNRAAKLKGSPFALPSASSSSSSSLGALMRRHKHQAEPAKPMTLPTRR